MQKNNMIKRSDLSARQLDIIEVCALRDGRQCKDCIYFRAACLKLCNRYTINAPRELRRLLKWD